MGCQYNSSPGPAKFTKRLSIYCIVEKPWKSLPENFYIFIFYREGTGAWIHSLVLLIMLVTKTRFYSSNIN